MAKKQFCDFRVKFRRNGYVFSDMYTSIHMQPLVGWET